jgi:hypothetical protein
MLLVAYLFLVWPRIDIFGISIPICAGAIKKQLPDMKKRFLVPAMLVSALGAVAQQHQNDIYNYTVYRQAAVSPAGRSMQKPQAESREKLAGWSLAFDQRSGLPADWVGSPLALTGSTAVQKANAFIADYLQVYGADAAQWQVRRNTAAGKAVYVDMDQVIDGHKVAFSRLGFRFTPDLKLIRLQAKMYNADGADASLKLGTAQALQAAQADLSGISITAATLGQDWVWFPVPAGNGYSLHPAYTFTIQGTSEGSAMPVQLTGYVDASDGAILYRKNEVKETFDVTVKGNVYKQNPTVASSLEPLPDLAVVLNGSTGYTDTAGLYTNSAITLPANATIQLQGKWSKVTTNGVTSTVPQFIDTVSANGTIYTYPVISPSGDRHVNAYYHVTRVHDFMKQYLPSFTGMDFVLPTNVDVTGGTCNAFYSPYNSTINFYAAGGGCNSFALNGDIIYHEYGHGISDKFYTAQSGVTMENGAMNEANSDIWALSITRDPVLGRGSIQGGAIIRRYDSTPKVYPQDIEGEVHADAEILAGAWWDVAVNLNSVDSMTRLFTETYYDLPDGPDGTEGDVYRSILVAALLNDDTDNDLTNGTPNFAAITSAFARHGIYLLNVSSFAHTEVSNTTQGTDIPVDATISVNYPAYLGGIKLVYRNRTVNTWDTLAMTAGTAGAYTANIPAQPEGAVVDYSFAMVDMTGNIVSWYPYGYYPQLNSQLSNIPYQFGVGLRQVTGTDFENEQQGWSITNTTDNATAGKWLRAIPVGSYANSAAGAIECQTNLDHTLANGTGQCLVTGNAASTSSSIGSADVDGGVTTVISPVYDLTGYTYPVVEYYRWFSNDMGANPGNDPWQAFISVNGGTSWRQVERTYVSDASWRRRIFGVKEYVTPSATMAFRFMASDSTLSGVYQQGQSNVEAAVDDFFIYDLASGVTGISETAIKQTRVYPNPANEALTVVLPESLGQTDLALYDLTGRVVWAAGTQATGQMNIDTRSVTAGQYMMVIRSGKAIHTQKIVIAH